MSLQFSDSTNESGIVELIRDLTKTKSNPNAYPLKAITRDVNLSHDKALSIIFKVGGKWQFDDSNHDDYPFIEADLISGQRDYAFTTDEQGNLVLDIYKVFVKNRDGIYYEIFPVDQQSDKNTESFWDGQNLTGTPIKYDKTGNGVLLDVPPNYSWRIGTELERGIKVLINREGSYFTTSDTTKKPGIAGLFHEYYALRPSYFYALRNGLKNKNDLKNEMLEMETDMKKHYRDRSKDEDLEITGQIINSI